jgi:two-component SAPR family response regulator
MKFTSKINNRYMRLKIRVKALQEFRRNYYDLILLDIKMPILNGFELCEKIRELDKAVHISFL